jgi:hypothetical protein
VHQGIFVQVKCRVPLSQRLWAVEDVNAVQGRIFLGVGHMHAFEGYALWLTAITSRDRFTCRSKTPPPPARSTHCRRPCSARGC